MKHLSVLAAVAAAGLLLQAPQAQASHWSNAVDACQGSLPSFEGALRKRPLGINNEGTSASFVSCSLESPIGAGVTGVFVLVTNRAAAASNISCTLVDGVAPPFGTPVYQPKTLPVPGGAGQVILSWEQAADNGGNPYALPNLNCALPPGMEINTLQVNTL